MKKKAFTLVEVLVAVIIIAVLAALSITTFQKTVQTHNDKLCQENLKVLQGAIEIYTLENNALPVILSQLTDEQINLAYSKVIGTRKDNKLLAIFKNVLGTKSALAIPPPLPEKYFGYNRKVLICPLDRSGDAVSYEVNPAITDLGNSDTEGQALVADKLLNHQEQSGRRRDYRMAINQLQELGSIFNRGTFIIDEWVIHPVKEPDFHPNATNCCVASQKEWSNLSKFRRTRCKFYGFKSPKKDGTPRGECEEKKKEKKEEKESP